MWSVFSWSREVRMVSTRSRSIPPAPSAPMTVAERSIGHIAHTPDLALKGDIRIWSMHGVRLHLSDHMGARATSLLGPMAVLGAGPGETPGKDGHIHNRTLVRRSGHSVPRSVRRCLKNRVRAV